jgi:hypothetical protein
MDLQRRRSARIALNWVISMESPAGMKYGTMKNLSLHGLFVRTEERVPLGENVAISFCEPGVRLPRIARVSAVAVRSEDDGVAFELRRIDLDSLILLRSIIGRKISQA